MQTLFHYNWMIREEWYQWCEDVSGEELLKTRTGGVGGILKTLFHITDVEWSWIQAIQGKPDFQEDFEQYNSLDKVRALDAKFRLDVEPFVEAWHDGLERRIFEDHLPDGRAVTDAWGEVMRHVIAHEIHHIGQLSVWSREIGKPPVSANLIGKGLMDGLPGRM
ncbi:DNA damage-inducible protein DinB [Paenibacillus albidus]|uniref:DNA damage-inducible protein DinB n=1 Tax=Paenibacillus albidus TaxID=2041023 RepID=A0A917C4K4_9BACL|nr:DinB family protein [Paenibacillus albidus]GGF71545.1 DNA damage-inducible protein DinB [Paenibacillus albidus]